MEDKDKQKEFDQLIAHIVIAITLVISALIIGMQGNDFTAILCMMIMVVTTIGYLYNINKI